MQSAAGALVVALDEVVDPRHLVGHLLARAEPPPDLAVVVLGGVGHVHLEAHPAQEGLGKVERWIQTVLRECLCQWAFDSSNERLESWVRWYNRHRPHRSLQGLPPTRRLAQPGPRRCNQPRGTSQLGRRRREIACPRRRPRHGAGPPLPSPSTVEPRVQQTWQVERPWRDRPGLPSMSDVTRCPVPGLVVATLERSADRWSSRTCAPRSPLIHARRRCPVRSVS